jgi:branched-chain amino acid transport system substrate-binding protein
VFAALAMTGVLLTGAACSSSGSSGTDAGASTTANQALLGTEKPATGQPIVIGLATEGKSSAIDSTGAIPTAQAAVKYVNTYLGGVAGRPIQLFICEMHASPTGASDCANQMIEKKVPVVLVDQTGEGQALVPPIVAAKIPVFGWSGSSAAEQTLDGAYSVTGGLAALVGGIAKYAQTNKISKVATLAIDVPAVIQGMQAIGGPAFKKAGVGLNIVNVPPGTADLTPQVQSAISSGAKALFFFGDKGLCAAGLKAAKTLGFTDPMFIVQQCIDPASVSAVPDGYKGVTITSVTDLADGQKEFELYRAVLTKFAPEVVEKSLRAGIDMQGYAVVTAFARAMDGLTGDITAASVSTQLKTAKDVPTPLGSDSQTFNCGKPPVSMFKSICSVGVQTTDLTDKGAPTTYKPVDPTGLFK